MLTVRERFSFDQSLSVGGWKYIETFAISDDRKTFYVRAGANSGVRFLAHRSEDGRWGIANRLHESVLVEVGPEGEGALMVALARAANEAMRHGAPPTRLVPIGDVPGFIPELLGPAPDAYPARHHRQRWYTRTVYALQIATPGWLPEGATVWDIAEGVYTSFADGSIRLAPRRDWFEFRDLMSGVYGSKAAEIIARQGDLLVNQWPSVVETGTPTQTPRMTGYGEGAHNVGTDYALPYPVIGCHVDIDRHHIEAREDTEDDPNYCLITMTHPQHETVTFRYQCSPTGWAGDYAYSPTFRMLPGTSRPFVHDGYGSD